MNDLFKVEFKLSTVITFLIEQNDDNFNDHCNTKAFKIEFTILFIHSGTYWSLGLIDT